ncbi:MAG: hypothetical protein OEW75_10355, partial [Cyclobacteriaceae bacterium]|nr:hypothetical protein [Cyclobacteriaceae bacterium]
NSWKSDHPKIPRRDAMHEFQLLWWGGEVIICLKAKSDHPKNLSNQGSNIKVVTKYHLLLPDLRICNQCRLLKSYNNQSVSV